VQLEWRKVKKANPFASSIRARMGPRQMPLNMVHDANRLPRIILTEPAGSSAEVGLIASILLSFLIDFSAVELTR
jgi:hypothetical protein